MYFDSGSSRRSHGFTLVELMVVLLIIGLLASVVTLSVRHFMVTGRQSAARLEISTICAAVETFHASMSRYPTNEEGIDILTKKSQQFPEPLLKQSPIDPWGRPYAYNSPGQHDAYEVLSLGADGREGGSGEDADIVSWDLKEKKQP